MRPMTDFLATIQQITKLHESMLKDICAEHGLSLLEAKVLSFLHNNPDRDTAADIVELRMLPKGNVSQAVESLVQKQLLSRRPDTVDRRRIHLSLTEPAAPIVLDLDVLRVRFQAAVFANISPEEQQQFEQIYRRLGENSRNAMNKGAKL